MLVSTDRKLQLNLSVFKRHFFSQGKEVYLTKKNFVHYNLPRKKNFNLIQELEHVQSCSDKKRCEIL